MGRLRYLTPTCATESRPHQRDGEGAKARASVWSLIPRSPPTQCKYHWQAVCLPSSQVSLCRIESTYQGEMSARHPKPPATDVITLPSGSSAPRANTGRISGDPKENVFVVWLKTESKSTCQSQHGLHRNSFELSAIKPTGLVFHPCMSRRPS